MSLDEIYLLDAMQGSNNNNHNHNPNHNPNHNHNHNHNFRHRKTIMKLVFQDWKGNFRFLFSVSTWLSSSFLLLNCWVLYILFQTILLWDFNSSQAFSVFWEKPALLFLLLLLRWPYILFCKGLHKYFSFSVSKLKCPATIRVQSGNRRESISCSDWNECSSMNSFLGAYQCEW